MPGGKSSKCDLYGQNSAGGINPLAESVFVQVGSDEEGIPKDAFWASKAEVPTYLINIWDFPMLLG
jgi:hypothetical protein